MKHFFILSREQDQEKILKLLTEVFQTLDYSRVWKVTIEKEISPRSQAQNNLYWLWLSILSAETGYTKDEWHCTFRDMFLYKEELKTITGDKIYHLPSTTKLTRKEFSGYLDRIEQWVIANLHELDIEPLPHPEDYAIAHGKKK